MMKVFDAALQVIQIHRIGRIYNLDGGPNWRCSGCAWTGNTQDEADSHLADMIDKEVD